MKRGKVGWISKTQQPDRPPHPNPLNGPGALVRSVAPSAPHGGCFGRASAIKVELLQPGKAIGGAAAQSYRFVIDYRHLNMMPGVTSVSLCLLGSPFHRTMPTQSSARPESLQLRAQFS